MEFGKENRSCQIPCGFRLATVDEAKQNLEGIKPLLNKWDNVRLLDGWMSAGPDGDIERLEVGFRHRLGYMLITPTAEVSAGGSARGAEVYGEVAVNEKGKQAALFLCVEDLNYEVVDWLLNSAWPNANNKNANKQAERHESEKEWIKEFSEAVSRFAREFHGGARASKTEERKEFTSESVNRMVQEILESESVQEFIGESNFEDVLEEFQLRSEHIFIGQSDFGDDLPQLQQICRDLSEHVSRAVPVSRDEELWDDGVLWGAIDSFVTHMAVVCKTVEILEECRGKGTYEFDEIAMSVLYYVNKHLAVTCLSDMERRKYVYDAVLKASYGQNISDKSHERDAMLGGDVRNHILSLAAEEADAQVVQKLLECGAQRLETDDQKKTALHRCAANEYGNEGQVLRSAKVLLENFSNREELVEACDAEGCTALHIASSSGRPLVCELLLRHGANLNAKDQSGQTPLHYAVRNKKQKVMDVLIKREIIDPRVISTSIVDSEDNEGNTPLDIAAAENNLEFFRMLLLSSKRAKTFLQKKNSGYILRESARRGYFDLVEKLLQNGANLLDSDDDGRTTLHYAAESENKKEALIPFQSRYAQNLDLTAVLDKNDRTVLHVAALNGYIELCEVLITMNVGSYMSKDRDGQTPLHYAVKHNNEAVVNALLIRSSVLKSSEKDKQEVDLRDLSGLTPLHIAAAQGNLTLVKTLLSYKQDPRIGDFLGETALHKAARIGHIEITKKLLESGSHPLHERDCDGKTALHYAVQVKKRDDAKAIAEMLVGKCKSKEEMSLLLWASAAGIGTAEESLTRQEFSNDDDPVKAFLEAQKNKIKDCNLLRTAARLRYIEMTQELLTRGVVQEIGKITEQASEQPTLSDSLGRNVCADGLAALFLNPYVKSPITVGISGEWGMGKSSLMFQTETILLKTAAQLAFPKLLEVHQGFPVAEELSLTKQGEKKCQKIRRSLELFLATDQESTTKENRLVDFLENYQQKYYAVYKSLAVMDRSDMIKRNGKRPDSNKEGMIEEAVPAILTVRYNAWQYRNECEAWAGLAVEITKEMEETMTLAQWLSTCWRTHKRSIWVGLILPCLLAASLACLVTWLAWLLLDRSKQKGLVELKYGSLAATLIVIVWTVVKSIMAVLKPISTQIADYVSLPDHTQKLGYHRQVIEDINLLKEEIGKRPNWLCTIIACLWCWISLDWSPNNVRGTGIPKMPPQIKGNLRIIVFVDDLDRCQESVILQVVIKILYEIIEHSLNSTGVNSHQSSLGFLQNRRNYRSGEEDDRQSHNKELPLDLPDPSDTESKNFLLGQLGSLEEDSESLRRLSTNSGRTHEEDEAGKEENIIEIEGSKERKQSSDVGVQGEDIPTPEIERVKEREESSAPKMVGGVRAAGSGETTINVCENQNEAPRSDQVVTSRFLCPIRPWIGSILYKKNGNEAPDIRRLPREWKRMLNYHRLAWSIFFKSEEAKSLAGWQVQLIAWIFVCWQWKDRINTLIESVGSHPKTYILQTWHKLDSLRNWPWYAAEVPSLRVIIDRYIEEKEKTLERTYPVKGEDKEETIDGYKEDSEEREHRGRGTHEKGKRKGLKRVASEEESSEEESEDWGNLREDWIKLREALSRYDVSMEGIQAFQKFRFYCIAGYLPWPIPNTRLAMEWVGRGRRSKYNL
eukprot:Gb_27687 [translate_table: standard]